MMSQGQHVAHIGMEGLGLLPLHVPPSLGPYSCNVQRGHHTRRAAAVHQSTHMQGDEIVCRLHVAGGAPITASRFSALYHPGGDDDMFSADLSQQQLEVRTFVFGLCGGPRLYCEVHLMDAHGVAGARGCSASSSLYPNPCQFSHPGCWSSLQAILSPVGALPCLVLASGADEAAPPGADIAGQVGRSTLCARASAACVLSVKVCRSQVLREGFVFICSCRVCMA